MPFEFTEAAGPRSQLFDLGYWRASLTKLRQCLSIVVRLVCPLDSYVRRSPQTDIPANNGAVHHTQSPTGLTWHRQKYLTGSADLEPGGCLYAQSANGYVNDFV